jgi:hypothetical protein
VFWQLRRISIEEPGKDFRLRMAPLARLLGCHTWRALAQSPYATKESSSMSDLVSKRQLVRRSPPPTMEIAHYKLPQQQPPPYRLQAAVDARTKASPDVCL